MEYLVFLLLLFIQREPLELFNFFFYRECFFII